VLALHGLKNIVVIVCLLLHLRPFTDARSPK